MTDQPNPYVASLIAEIGDRDPLELQAELVPALRAAMAGLGDADLRRAEAPGKWSVLQVVQHLADIDLVYGYRIRMILTHDRPEFPPFDRDNWAVLPGYGQAQLADVLEELDALRRRNLRLYHALDSSALDRVGIHHSRGAEAVRTTIALLAGHDLVHRRQIERIKRAIA